MRSSVDCSTEAVNSILFLCSILQVIVGAWRNVLDICTWNWRLWFSCESSASPLMRKLSNQWTVIPVPLTEYPPRDCGWMWRGVAQWRRKSPVNEIMSSAVKRNLSFRFENVIIMHVRGWMSEVAVCEVMYGNCDKSDWRLNGDDIKRILLQSN